MSDAVPLTLTHQVIADFTAIRKRLESENTPTTRRELVRATFSAVEGLLWQLKERIANDASIFARLTPHELAALAEESYSVDQRGMVKAQPRFLQTAVAVRLVVSVVQKYRPEYSLDFTHAGWQCLKDAIEVRNRIMHPRALEDLEVSDEDIAACQQGFGWFLAFVIEVMRETAAHRGIWKDAPAVGLFDEDHEEPDEDDDNAELEDDGHV
jgi:hypothetical protein